MAERSKLSSRDAQEAKKIAMSSVLNQTGGTKQEVEEPDRRGGSSGLLSSVVTVTVTFVSLSLVLLAINSYLEIDVPTLEDVPKRIVYIIRIHGYAAVIIPIAIIVHLVSPSSVSRVLSLSQSASQFVLLAMISTILTSLEEEYSKLVILCLAIWVVGRFSTLASVCISEQCHLVPNAVSLFPILVVVVQMLISLWEHGPSCGLDEIGHRTETQPETGGFFF